MKSFKFKNGIMTGAAMVVLLGAGFSVTAFRPAFAASQPQSNSTQPAVGSHAHAWGRHHRGFAMFGILKDVAAYIGVTPKELGQDLHAGQSLAQIAAAHNISASALSTKIESLIQARLSTAVSKGRMTQAQATAREQKIAAKLPSFLDKTGWKLRMDLPHHSAEPMRPMFGVLKDAATALNISAQQLKTDLLAGQTLSQIATSKGVAASTVEQNIEAAMTKQIDTLVPKLMTKAWHPGHPGAPADTTTTSTDSTTSQANSAAGN